jgi:hypothetical protein
MALDELRQGDADTLPQLEASRDRFVTMQYDIDAELAAKFREHDEAAEGEARQRQLGAIRAILNRRRYIRNLIQEINKEFATRQA